MPTTSKKTMIAILTFFVAGPVKMLAGHVAISPEVYMCFKETCNAKILDYF